MRPADPRGEEQRAPTPGLSTHARPVCHHPSPPPSEEDQALSPGRSRVFACRCARGFTSLPQGSLAPTRVLLSRALIAYSDPIRQSREHAAASRLGRLCAAPSLCGSASATRGTFPTFTAVLSRRAVDHTPVGPRCCPVARAHSGARLPRFVPESPPTRARDLHPTSHGS